MTEPRDSEGEYPRGYDRLWWLWLALLGAAALLWLTGNALRCLSGRPCEWASDLATVAVNLAFLLTLPLAAGYVAGPDYPRRLPRVLRGGLMIGFPQVLFTVLGLALIGLGLTAVVLDPGVVEGLAAGHAGAWWILVAMPASGIGALWSLIAGRRLRRRSADDA